MNQESPSTVYYFKGRCKINFLKGRNPSEWNKLANWFDKYQIYHPQVRWLIQTPRLYEVFF